MTNDHNTDPHVSATDDDQLRALFRRMCTAWTDGDAEAYGSCFTPDCDYVSFDGTRAKGREPMIAAHDKLFRGVLFGTALIGEVESIRHLTPDVALLHGTGSVLVAWRSELPKRRLTRNTLVAVSGPEGWQVTAIHNGRIRPVQIPETDSLPSRLARGLVATAATLGIGWAGKTGATPAQVEMKEKEDPAKGNLRVRPTSDGKLKTMQRDDRGGAMPLQSGRAVVPAGRRPGRHSRRS